MVGDRWWLRVVGGAQEEWWCGVVGGAQESWWCMGVVVGGNGGGDGVSRWVWWW